MKKLKKDYGLGVKAGLLTGLVFGIVGVIFSLFTISTLVEGPYALIFGSFMTSGMYLALYMGLPLMVIFAGLTAGLWFGVLYVALVNILPGRLYSKALTLSLVLWFFTNGLWNLIAGKIGSFFLMLLVAVLYAVVFAAWYKWCADRLVSRSKGLEKLVKKHKPAKRKRKRR